MSYLYNAAVTMAALEPFAGMPSFNAFQIMMSLATVLLIAGIIAVLLAGSDTPVTESHASLTARASKAFTAQWTDDSFSGRRRLQRILSGRIHDDAYDNLTQEMSMEIPKPRTSLRRKAVIFTPFALTALVLAIGIPTTIGKVPAEEAWAGSAAVWASDVYGVDGGIEELLAGNIGEKGGQTGTVLVDGEPQNVTMEYIDGEYFLMTTDENAELPRVGKDSK